MSHAGAPTGKRGGARLPRFTLALTALAAALYGLSGPAPDALVFDRAAITQGEWWRLLSGHLVHSDFAHFFWDLIAFALIGALVEQFGTGRLIAVSLMSIVLIDAWLWWGTTELRWYCGLSGIVNALITLLIYQLWQQGRSVWIGISGAVYLTKLLVESLTGVALLTATAWPSLPSVHLVGALASILVATVAHQSIDKRLGRTCDIPRAAQIWFSNRRAATCPNALRIPRPAKH